MKLIIKAAVIGAGLFALSACGPKTPAAENVQANAEATADNIEEAADNVSNDTVADAMDNNASAVRAAGDNAAEAIDANAANSH
jgi:predicted small lipoprotein YifL